MEECQLLLVTKVDITWIEQLRPDTHFKLPTGG